MYFVLRKLLYNLTERPRYARWTGTWKFAYGQLKFHPFYYPGCQSLRESKNKERGKELRRRMEEKRGETRLWIHRSTTSCRILLFYQSATRLPFAINSTLLTVANYNYLQSLSRIIDQSLTFVMEDVLSVAVNEALKEFFPHSR